MERVVLNALAKTRGFAAGYLRLRRIKAHRLEDKPIHLRLHSHRIEIRGEIAVEREALGVRTRPRVAFDHVNVSPSNAARQNTPAHFAETNAVTIALAPAGDR